ncbi:uncharacterized protein, partial [Halyomorpha halys]|uniref:uncharacterized protein n=1 Tax=Halyomorpha halys TaxID=286706 RepID=UPI0034D22AA1
ISDHKKKAQLFCTSIGKDHYNNLAALLRPDQPIRDIEFVPLVSHFEQMLALSVSTVVSQHYFLCLTQHVDQSILDYVAALKGNLKDYDFYTICSCKKKISIAETFLRAQFIRGLKDGWIREQMLQDSSLKEFVDIVKKATALEASSYELGQLEHSTGKFSEPPVDAFKKTKSNTLSTQYCPGEEESLSDTEYGIGRIQNSEDSFNLGSDRDKYFVTVKLNSKPQTFEIDSGARFSLISEPAFRKLSLDTALEPTTVSFHSYLDHIIKPMGKVTITVTYKNRTIDAELYVVPAGYDALLGRVWIHGLGFILNEIGREQHSSRMFLPINSVTPLEDIFHKNSSIFEPRIGKQWLFKYGIDICWGVRCYYAVTKSIPSITFYLNDCLRSRLNINEPFIVSPMEIPDQNMFIKSMYFIENNFCPFTSIYKLDLPKRFNHKFRYKREVFEQIYDHDRKSLIMPKCYQSVIPYSIFERTSFSREKYIFYEPLTRDFPLLEPELESDPKPAMNPKAASKSSVSSSVMPEKALQSALISSLVLHLEMMECYSAIVFHLMDRTLLFDLIRPFERKDSSFSSIISSLDIWKKSMLMNFPFHLIVKWFLKINDIDLRFMNKYISRHSLRMERNIYQRQKGFNFYTHPKVIEAENKFFKTKNVVFTHYRKIARMFSSKEEFNNVKRKGFHCYSIGPYNKLMKNKRFKNNILSKRFWGSGRRQRYNSLLQKLVIKKLFKPKPFLSFLVKNAKTSANTEIKYNYSIFCRYLDDLDKYIGFSDTGLERCHHAKPQELCYNTSKYLRNKILFKFFDLADKCSRIKKWLLTKYIPELGNFFLMMLDLIKLISYKDELNKVNRRRISQRPKYSTSRETWRKTDDSSEDVSSKESSTFGKLYRSFSRSLYLSNETRYKEQTGEMLEKPREPSKGITRDKYSSFPTMMSLELINVNPLIRDEFCFTQLSKFGNAFINRYNNETSDLQLIDFVKYRLPTEIIKSSTNDDNKEESEKQSKTTKISRGLSRVVAGKDRTFEKLMTLIRPTANEISAQTDTNTKLEGPKAVAVSATVNNDGTAPESPQSPIKLKAQQSVPDLLDGPSIDASDPSASKHQPSNPPSPNPIINFLIFVFSSKTFNRYKELNFLQNYLLIGKPLGKHFQKLKKSDSTQIYKSHLAVIKPVSSKSSQHIKVPTPSKKKKTAEKRSRKVQILSPDMKHYLKTHLGYLSGLLKSTLDREMSKAGFYVPDKSSSSSTSSESIESIDSISSGYLPSELYKLFETHEVIEPRKETKARQEDDRSSSSSSASRNRTSILPGQQSRESYFSAGGTSESSTMRKAPLTIDNVTTFRMAMSSMFDSIRAHIIDLSNYPIEKMFTCLADLRVPTSTQLMLEFYTQTTSDFVPHSDSEENDPSETKVNDDSDIVDNIAIEPSGSVLNIKLKSYSESLNGGDQRFTEDLDEETEENNKYTIFQRLISEPFYCVLPQNFIDSLLNIIEEGAENGGILNPLCINRLYYEALRRYYRQIEQVPYKEVPVVYRDINQYETSKTKNSKEVHFHDFLLDLAKKFVNLLYRFTEEKSHFPKGDDQLIGRIDAKRVKNLLDSEDTEALRAAVVCRVKRSILNQNQADEETPWNVIKARLKKAFGGGQWAPEEDISMMIKGTKNPRQSDGQYAAELLPCYNRIANKLSEMMETIQVQFWM